MPEFEVFKKRLVPLVKTPYVTIQKRGVISFNLAAFQALGSPDAVELLWSPSERIMGFRAIPESEEHAYPVRQANAGKSFMLSGTALIRYYEIDIPETTRWGANMLEDVLCIDLKDAGTVVTNSRGRARQLREAESHASDSTEAEPMVAEGTG